MRNCCNIKITAMAVLLFIGLSMACFAEEATVEIRVDREIGAINKKIFGGNLIGYDPKTFESWNNWGGVEFYGYSDYGAGIWDPVRKEPVKEVIDLARSAGMTMARFPGGCGAHHYDWKNAIGKDRKHFLYGIDEFLRTCGEIGCEPVITVSYFTGDERDAADLVEYLNTPYNGAKAVGGRNWAAERVKNGHILPYGVRYFEIGNEVYDGDYKTIKKIYPEDYARRYLKYYNAMKAIDPAVKIGVVFHSPRWNEKVMEIVKDKTDFAIIHTYPGVGTNELGGRDPNEIFKITLAAPLLIDEGGFKKAAQLLKTKSSRKVPLAITEYNAGFVQETPVPYRQCLGAALLNAEMLKLFMKPDNDILMANYWQFSNEYWGMVCNGFGDNYRDLRNPYYKRPNYYLFELYHLHFGDILLSVSTRCGSYTIKAQNIPYLSVNASKSRDGKKIYIMVVNKNMYKGVSADLKLDGFIGAEGADAWILNGPAIDATNEKYHDNVAVRHESFGIKNNKFSFTFEPHSLTSIEITKHD